MQRATTHSPQGLVPSARRAACLASVFGIAMFTGASSAANETRPVFFVVAEIAPFHNDSYVLALEDSAHVAHARLLIAQGPHSGLPSIVVAEIAAGADGVNRDVRAPGQPEWSWHVSEFLAFAELTVEICDGWPTFVESDVDGWIANTGGRICFWSYTIVEELTTPVQGARWGALKRLYR